MSRLRQSYPVRPGLFLRDFVLDWGVIFASAYLTRRFGFWIYPLTALVIANRIFALFLLSHEGLHRNLLPNVFWNDFIARYIVAFPIFVSLSKYRREHLIHHSRLGRPGQDPDYHLYSFYPVSGRGYFWRSVWATLTLRLPLAAIVYVTDWPAALTRRRTMRGELVIFSRQSDFVPQILFQIALGTVLFLSGHLGDFFWFVFVPSFFIALPYGLVINGFQHGPLGGGPHGEITRTVVGPAWLMELVVPCHAGFHAEHHLSPEVPHYWLSTYAKDLAGQGQLPLWRETVGETLHKLFINRPYRENSATAPHPKESSAAPSSQIWF